jgi:hypothetical protein
LGQDTNDYVIVIKLLEYQKRAYAATAAEFDAGEDI